jgi:hypothetical protein
MPEHDEWTKRLSDGTIVQYNYDEIIESCSASIEFVGRGFKSSRINIRGPLTREQVEALFFREIRSRSTS